MAFADLIPLMAVNVLDVARENAVMPRAVTNNYSTEVAMKGEKIVINVMNDFVATEIAPSPNIPAANNAVDPNKADLELNQWFGSSFALTEKQLAEIVDGGRMEALSAATRAVVNTIDTSVLGLYRYVYNTVGVAGTTPFAADTVPAKEANRLLSTGRAPKDRDRHMILDEFGYYEATDLPNFQRVDYMGADDVMRDATVPYTLGYNWWEDQNVPTHTSTAAGAYAVDLAATAGAQSLVIDDGAGALPTALAPGDLFTIAGDTQQYSVVSYTAGTNESTIEISPPLAEDTTDSAVITNITTAAGTPHVANLAFHRSAFHIAVRPVGDIAIGENAGREMIYPSQTISDPISGLNLTLKFFQGYHQTLAEVSALWGVTCPRPGFAVRIFG